MNPIPYLIARLREPSTHASIAAIFGLLCVLYPAQRDVLLAVAAVFATIGAASPDATSTATQAPALALQAEVDKS